MIKSTNLLIVFFTSFCFCYLQCSLLSAQFFQEADVFSLRETRPLEKNSHAERSAVKRNQIALDVGGLSNYSLSTHIELARST